MKKTKKAASKSVLGIVWRRSGPNYYRAKVGAFHLTVEMYKSSLWWDWAIKYRNDILYSGEVAGAWAKDTPESCRELAKGQALSCLQQLAKDTAAVRLQP